MPEKEAEQRTYINIIINNNNNNNYLVNPEVAKCYEKSAAKQKLVEDNNYKDLPSSKILLDYSHKYEKKIYKHKEEDKDLSYPDVPPNSFDFDEFDIKGFLNSITKIGELNMIQGNTHNLNIRTFNDNFKASEECSISRESPYSQYDHPVYHPKIKDHILKKQAMEVQKMKIYQQSQVNSQTMKTSKLKTVKNFKTREDMKKNASLQLRKIKFFWRGTQTNLPYIFKKLTFERNPETNIIEGFEKFEYSKKKIKSNLEDRN